MIHELDGKYYKIHVNDPGDGYCLGCCFYNEDADGCGKPGRLVSCLPSSNGDLKAGRYYSYKEVDPLYMSLLCLKEITDG